jgi:hypothetical protein
LIQYNIEKDHKILTYQVVFLLDLFLYYFLSIKSFNTRSIITVNLA